MGSEKEKFTVCGFFMAANLNSDSTSQFLFPLVFLLETFVKKKKKHLENTKKVTVLTNAPETLR